MAEIEDYVKAIFYRDFPRSLKLAEGFFRRTEIIPNIKAASERVLSEFNISDDLDLDAFSEEIFDEWVNVGLLFVKSDPFAGNYYSYTPSRLDQVRLKALEASDIHQTSKIIGGRFYADVFNAYLGINPLTAEERFRLSVPASDRIVSFQHNQIDELERPLDELIDELDRDNGVPDHPGLKERLSGQIKAGRELIRSGTFRAYLLHVVLIRALGELIERYKGHAIAMVAASLIDLLVKSSLQAG